MSPHETNAVWGTPSTHPGKGIADCLRLCHCFLRCLPDRSLQAETGFHNGPDTATDRNFRLAGAEKSLGPESSLQPVPVDNQVTCRHPAGWCTPNVSHLEMFSHKVTSTLPAEQRHFCEPATSLTAHALAISGASAWYDRMETQVTSRLKDWGVTKKAVPQALGLH